MWYLSQDPRFLATPVIARALRSPSLAAEFMTFRSITARVRTPDHAIDLMIDRTRAQSKEIVNLHTKTPFLAIEIEFFGTCFGFGVAAADSVM